MPASQVQAIILGEHGDSMVPIWSSATVAGLPLEQWPGFTRPWHRKRSRRRRRPGATVIKLKGGSSFAVGHVDPRSGGSLARDSRRVLPVSTLQQGLYGVRDVCLSVPTVVGCGGCRQQIELPLTPKERLGIQQSAQVLREIIDQVEARIGKVRAAGGESPVAQRQRRPASKRPTDPALGLAEGVNRLADDAEQSAGSLFRSASRLNVGLLQ